MPFKIRSVRYNFMMNLILTGSTFLVPLVTFPLVSRALLPDTYGLCSWATSVASWASLIAMLGVNKYGVREIAKVREDQEVLRKTTFEILSVVLISTVIVCVVYVASLFFVDKFTANIQLMLINGCLIICETLGCVWFFSGIEQYQYIAIRGVAVKAACLVGIFFFVKKPSDYLLYAALLTAATCIADLVNFAYMLHILQVRSILRTSSLILFLRSLDLKRHLRPIFTMFFIAMAMSVYTNLDTIMLGFLSTDTQVGYYTAAIKIKTVLQGAAGALTGVLLPRISNMLSADYIEESIALIKKSTLVVLVGIIPICVFISLASSALLSFYAGNSFCGAGPTLSIVSLAVIPIALSSIFCDAVMLPLGYESYCSIIYAIAALVDFVGNILLIPICGSVGAALMTSFVELMIALTEFCIIKRFIWSASSASNMRERRNSAKLS